MTESSLMETPSTLPSYEKECRQRIDDWERDLKKFACAGDGGALLTLKTAIEAQLALADLRIRVRQADYARAIVWLQIILPIAGIILGAFIAGLLRR